MLGNFIYITVLFFLSCLLASCANQDKSSLLDQNLTMAPSQWISVNASTSAFAPSQLSTKLTTELRALVQEAIKNNRDLHAAASLVDIASAKANVSGGELWPILSLNVDGNHYEKVEDNSTQSFTSYSTTLSASWEVDVWGRLSDSTKASVRDLDAEKFNYEAARQSLIANVVITWLEVLEAHQLLMLTKNNLSIQRRRLNQLEFRLDLGLIETLDVRLTRNNVASLEDRLVRQDATYHRALRKLEVLLGRYPQAKAISVQLLPQFQHFNPETAPADIIQYRPDIRAKEQQLLAAELRVSEAKKKLWPQLKISTTFEDDNDVFFHLFDFDKWLSSFSAALLQPIFQGGALRAGVFQQQAQARLLVAQYQQLVLNAWREVENYLYGEHIFFRRVAVLERALHEAQAAETLTLRKYEEGLVNSFELLTAQNRSIEAEADLISARIASVVNRVRLHLALGVELDK